MTWKVSCNLLWNTEIMIGHICYSKQNCVSSLPHIQNFVWIKTCHTYYYLFLVNCYIKATCNIQNILIWCFTFFYFYEYVKDIKPKTNPKWLEIKLKVSKYIRVIKIRRSKLTSHNQPMYPWFVQILKIFE